jgi:D-alanine transaminase
MLVYLNGRYIERDQALISVNDRGFVFADGVYEVCRVAEGRIFQYDAHMQRMERGLRELRIAAGADAGRAQMREIALRLLRENDQLRGEATIYIQITRGVAPRTHAFPPAGTPATTFVSTAPFTPLVAQCAAGVPAISMPDIRWTRCDLKTVNLLPNVLGKQQAVDAGATEAIFIRDGLLAEGSSTNVFAVLDGVIRTHPKNNLILPGITRDVVLGIIAEKGLPVREAAITSAELARVEELFLTGTTTDVMPIVKLDGRPVGPGRPGPIAKALYDVLAARIAGGATVAV